MRYSIFLFLIGTLVSCETPAVRQDNRQLTAKSQIRRKLPRGAEDFNVTAFKEDTLSWTDSTFKKPIRYSLDIEYKDSSGLQKKTGYVIFTPDGKSVISSQITERNQ